MLRQYHDKSSTKKKVHWESHFTEKRYWKDDILSTCGHLRIQQSCFFTKYLQAVKTKKKKSGSSQHLLFFSTSPFAYMCLCPGCDKMKKKRRADKCGEFAVLYKAQTSWILHSARTKGGAWDPKKHYQRRFRDILTSSTVPVSKVDKLVKRP